MTLYSPLIRLPETEDNDALESPWDIAFQVIGNGVGSGSFKMKLDDPARSLLQPKTLVDFYLFDPDTSTQHFIVRTMVADRQIVDVTDNEEVDECYEYRCLTLEEQFRAAVVYPSTPMDTVTTPSFTGKVSKKPYSRERHFGPMDPSFSTTSWADGVEVLGAGGDSAPSGWNTPQASWIGSTDGFHHYRKTFTTSGASAVVIYFALRDEGEVWLDGSLVARTEAASGEDPDKTRRVVVEVSNGTHVLYVWAQRRVSTNTLALVAVYARYSDTLLAYTNSSWKMSRDSLGMTPGAIVIKLMEEAEARGVDLGGIEPGFTADEDSINQAWPIMVGQPAFRIGEDTLLDVLDQLSEAYVDYAVDYRPLENRWVLNMWLGPGVIDGNNLESPGRGFHWSWEYAKGVNASTVELRETSSGLKTVGLVAFDGGFVEVQDSTAVSDWGRYETGVNLPTHDVASSAFTAKASLLPISQPETSLTLRVEPRYMGDTPHLGFAVYDWVNVNADEVNGSYRVLGVTCEEDDVANLTWMLEMATVRDVEAQRYSRFLRRTNGGTLDGRSRTATVTSPSVVRSAEVVDPYTDTISTSGDFEPAGGETSARKNMDGRRRLVKITASAATAGTGSTVLWIQRNGSNSSSITLGANQATATTWITNGAVWNYGDYYGLRCASAGGHAGISVTGYWVEVGG